MPPKKSLVSDDEYSEDEFEDELDEEEGDRPDDVKSILKGVLSAPIYTQTAIRAVYDMCQTGNVHLNPSYQRDVVWNETKMIKLIQSLFLNYFIPPVLFAVHTNEYMEDVRTCIDGKQRITSILHFLDGSIPFISPHTKVRYLYRKTPDGPRKTGKLLPAALKNRFDQMQLLCVEYRQISDMQQRDLFQRVQMGVTLSAAEKLQAIPGPWPAWIFELIQKFVSEPNTLGTTITWVQSRGKAFQNIAGFVILAHDQTKTAVPSAQQIDSFLVRSDSPDLHFRRKVEMALALFVEITTDHFAESFGVVQQRVAPVEFVYTALLIFNRMSIFSVPTLARYIGQMRLYIRNVKGHFDVRTNTRVSRDFYEYIIKLPKRSSNPDERPAAEEFEGEEVDPRNIRAAKRARRSEAVDPSYRDTAVDRFDNTGLGNATRGQKNTGTTNGGNESNSGTVDPYVLGYMKGQPSP